MGLLLIILITTTVSAQDVVISPGTLELELVGGCSATKDIIVKNSGPTTINFEIETNVTPNSDGIDITYSTGPTFTLTSGKTIIIQMIIDTSMLLAPDTYVILTKFYGTSTSEPKPKKEDIDSFYSPVIPQEEDEPVWAGGGPTEDEELPKPLPITAKTPSIPTWLIFFVLALIGLLIILLILLKRKEDNK